MSLRKRSGFFLTLLGILGFSACGHMEKYGVPEASYKYRGTVTDAETSEPIPNIQVKLENQYSGWKDSTQTNENGIFFLETFGFHDNELIVTGKDIDGESNGRYEDKEVTMNVTHHNITDEETRVDNVNITLEKE